MRVSLFVSALVAPLALAAPTLETRQAAPVKPAPCVRNSKVTVEETRVRSEQFAQAFIYKRDISKAFTFIAVDYVVCCPPTYPVSTRGRSTLGK